MIGVFYELVVWYCDRYMVVSWVFWSRWCRNEIGSGGCSDWMNLVFGSVRCWWCNWICWMSVSRYWCMLIRWVRFSWSVCIVMKDVWFVMVRLMVCSVISVVVVVRFLMFWWLYCWFGFVSVISGWFRCGCLMRVWVCIRLYSVCRWCLVLCFVGVIVFLVWCNRLSWCCLVVLLRLMRFLFCVWLKGSVWVGVSYGVVVVMLVFVVLVMIMCLCWWFEIV